jgi:transposase
MAKPLLPDALWDRIAHLFPPRPEHPKGGRPWLSDRQCLIGIIVVLRSGLPWALLPRELGCGSGVTCWRRLREWQETGLWETIHRYLLDELGYAGGIDWSRAIIDSASSRAVFGGPTRGPTPRTAPHGASNAM